MAKMPSCCSLKSIPDPSQAHIFQVPCCPSPMSVPSRVRRGPVPGRPGTVTEALPHLPQTAGIGDACTQRSLFLPPFPGSGLQGSLMVLPAFSCSFPVFSHKGGPLNKTFGVFNPMQSPTPLATPTHIHITVWGKKVNLC